VTELHELVAGLREEPYCVVTPPADKKESTLVGLPEDLRQFYEICDGVALFVGSPFVWTIVGSHHLVPTNLEVIGEQVEDDITSTWFVIARQSGDSNALISIDLNPKRLGWCYDSDAEVHGLVGDCAILAYSFTELLQQLVDSRGQELFWTSPQFVSKGDAYDPIDNSSI
jgi:hypothetical protein